MWSRLLQIGLCVGLTSATDHHRHNPSGYGHHLARRAEGDHSGYVSPISLGGDMYFRFEGQPTTKPEPINIIISGDSSFANNNGSTNYAIFNSTGGFSQYLSALNFSDECLGLHLSTPAYANISGPTPQLLDFLYRENFGEYPGGTCKETLLGGYHFRGWRQQESKAFFLAASQELNLTLKHDLVPNGFDLGRDEFVRRAGLGGKDYFGCVWPPASVSNITNLVKPDAGGPTGMYNHDIGIDGIVALVNVGAPNCNGNSTYTGKTWSSVVPPPRTASPKPSSTSDTTTAPSVPINPPDASKSTAAREKVASAVVAGLAILLLGVIV